LSLSRDGKLLASASSKGTLIRVFSNGERLSLKGELRRGSEPVRITSLCFKPDSNLLAVAGDQGTLHIFHVHPDNTGPREAAKGNRTLKLAALVGDLLPEYFSSEWSWARCRIPKGTAQVSFLLDDSGALKVQVLVEDNLLVYAIDRDRGGEAVLERRHKLESIL